MATISDKPRHAPPGYERMAPCVDISGQKGGIPFPEYTGSGVRLEEHLLGPLEIRLNEPVSARCAACGSENTLCIYLSYVAGLGTGKDMTVELVCLDCGKYTVNSYID
ncbi:MAG: hypothetical protein JXA21_06725 [Anaerolineae bacterium]|nr:hypothetical protein [Anaerolineae bacterium]